MQEQFVVMGQLMKLEGIYKCLEKLNKNGNFKIHLKKISGYGIFDTEKEIC